MLKDVDKSLVWKLMLLHVFIIALSNWAVQFGGVIPLIGVAFTWGMFTFPFIIIATDLTVRLTNKHNARAVVGLAFIPAIIISSFLSNPMIGFASALAYLVGQLLDVSVFQYIREKLTETWWVAPGLSSVFANIIDTYLFFWAAFAFSSDPFMSVHWVEIATVDAIFKVLISLMIFLPLYGMLLSYLKKKLVKA